MPVPLELWTKLKQEAALAEAQNGLANQKAEAAGAAKAVLELKLRSLLVVMQRVAQGTACPQATFGGWIDEAGISLGEAERWSGGAVRAESFAHVHQHFSEVAELNKQLQQLVSEQQTELTESNKEKERLAELLRKHGGGEK